VNRRILAASTIAAGLALGTAACSSSPGTPASSAPSSVAPSAAAPAPAGAGAAAADFGTGCASVPRSGAGSFGGMSTAPVATAASNNPVLSTLVTAVKKAGLVDTLASGKAIRTLEGATIRPAMISGSYSVNGAQVVCGNVQTANATVYIINTVLMPPSS